VTYRWLTDLDAALRAGGVPYTEVGPSSLDPTGASSWRTRGRPSSTGNFDVSGVVCHHTASPAGTTPQGDLNVILAGNSQAPGPISQLYIGRDARCYLVAAGRANHAGSGKRPGLDSYCTDQNALNIGIEAGNNGVGERWSDPMCDIYAAAVAALCDHYGWGTDHVYLHATTGPPSGGCNSKIDPAGPWSAQPSLVGSTTWDLNTWRAYVGDRWPGANAPDVIPEVDDMAIALYQPSDAVACFVGYRDSNGWFLQMQWCNTAVYNQWKGAGAELVKGSVAGLRGVTLVGPLPTDDGKHRWTGAEFADWLDR
jgi:hypothetical protein